MPDDILREALGRATDTVAAAVGRGVLAESGRLIASRLGPGPYKIIADENTWEAAGQAVVESLVAAGAETTEPLIFPGRPVLYASQDNADRIRDELGAAFPVAVGAGTLNDLVKLAAFELGRDYACVGTAASMDGYTGAGAPMSKDGVKVTRACKAPAVIVIDLDVVAAAPKHLTASGYGDLAAKIPGGADWILADITGVEPIDAAVWRLVQSGVGTALSDPDALAAGEPDAFQGLVEGLCLSGLAMQAYGGTRPASGAEHYFSHLWELAGLGADREVPLSHGAKVAVGSLAMCAFYEALLARDLSALDVDAIAAKRSPWPEIEADIRARFDGALANHAVKETRAKYLAGPELADRLRPLIAGWAEAVPRLRAQLVPTAELADRLHRAGAPSRPEDIGVTGDEVRALFPKAMYYRSRYTALDVAWELGLFDDLVADVFDRIWT
ncbi:MAG: sn-glycerol-1-phosphate dehydrogenase [Propionibacteriaceae bacterium]|nr:sn-glycerol-1-phosphate dehydrogenase [Propionibacteriaceae bacterium]